MKISAICMLFTPFLTSFVLLGKNAQRLPVSVESPDAIFHWSTANSAPSITEKDKFKDGSYANYTDEELTPILIQEAMDQWNSVRGSYLRFQMQTETSALSPDKTDLTNNMIVKNCPSATVAAYAAPTNDKDGNIIADCDVVICNIKTTALNLVETLTHELGHCVGLGHPHTNYNAIMSYSRSGNSYRLSADDKAGAIYLYPDPAIVNGESKELIGCGTILGQNLDANQGPWLYWILTLPIIAGMLRRSRPGQSLKSK
jgi:hypothetical protein